jgi:hypothetical protein
MTKRTKFILTTIWILVSRSYDVYCTAQLTPDLSKESNPLVSILGMTWTPLLITVGLLTLYALYAFYNSTFKPINLLPTEKGYTFCNIVAFTYLGRKDEWTAIFYKYPKSLKRFNQYVGHTLTQCLVYAGIVSTLMWLLINYTAYYKTIHSAPLIYAILILGCGIVIYKWNKDQYAKYLNEQLMNSAVDKS